MVQNDIWIERACREQGMIEPWVDRQVKTNEHGEKILSYGLSSFGYDIRLGGTFFLFEDRGWNDGFTLDPKNPPDTKNEPWKMYMPRERHMDKIEMASGKKFILQPRAFALAHSIERFKIPSDVLMLVTCKSSYARIGLNVNNTTAEPGWEGYLTLELSNTAPVPIAVYPFEGIAQCLFFRGDPCLVSYADRQGKYQNQPAEPVLAKV